MRINSNRQIHKKKRDPYQTLLRVTGILAIVVAVSFGIFYVCTLAVRNEYNSRRAAVAQENATAEQEFNAKMNALRNNNAASIDPETGEVTEYDFQYWERELDGVVWRVEDESPVGLENYSTVTIDRATLTAGPLLLVNAWHPLPSDFSDAELVSVGNTSGWKIQVNDGNVRLFPAAYDSLEKMLTAAGEAGMKDYIVRAAYRSNDEQTELFNSKMEKLSKDYTGDILIEQTKKYVNYPGTSEYQTGLSFQMNVYNKEDPSVAKQGFQASESGKWMTNNSWKYGVIFRFPTEDFPNTSWEDKSYKTGVSTQLNLYRYVGKPHSVAMQVMNYCLEEYVEFLIDHPHICVYEDGTLKYEMYRISGAEGDSFDLPVPNPASDYVASFDNMGGIVMAYIYNQ